MAYVGATHKRVELDAIEADLEGFVVGGRNPIPESLEGPPVFFFHELHFNRDVAREIGLFELVQGGEYGIPISDFAAIGADFHVSYAIADVDAFRASNELFGVGLGLFGDVYLGSGWVLHAQVRARRMWDETEDFRCLDGSDSNGDCVGSGGIDFAHDRIGDGWIFESTLGAKFTLRRL